MNLNTPLQGWHALPQDGHGPNPMKKQHEVPEDVHDSRH